MALNRKYFGITVVVLILAAVLAHAAGFTINQDGTLAPITVAGDITATGRVQAQAGFGYVPVGTVLPWYNTSATAPLPTGWYKCNGQSVAVPSGGEGDLLDGSTNATFVTPNLNAYATDGLGARGVFLRGGTTAGVVQGDAFQGHWHTTFADQGSGGATFWGLQYWTGNRSGTSSYEGTQGTVRSPANDGANGSPRVTNETRPLNMSVIYIIRLL